MNIHTQNTKHVKSGNERINLRRQIGLSFVELMISIAIGLILLAGLSLLIVQQNSTRTELDKSTRQIENGRYAMQLLKDDIQLAGYYGDFPNVGSNAVTAPTSLPDPCATSATSLLAALPFAVQGYDSPTSVPSPLSNCLADANHLSGTDIVVIRRADTDTISTTSAVTGQPYIQTTYADKILGIGGTTTFSLKQKDGTTSANLRNYLVHIYFISPCSVPTGSGGTVCTSTDDNGSPIPTLKMLELGVTGGAAAFSSPPTRLVEGIENLQLDYGLDSDNDGAPDSYTTAPTATDWANVMAIRVNLLARNNTTTPGYSDTNTYSLGLTSVTVPTQNQAYKRHAFSELVRLINPSGRREQ